MSIEANTYEELSLKNINGKTGELAEAIGNYLLTTWGIINLTLNVDGKEYSTEEDSISKINAELVDICKNLSNRTEICLTMRSCNGGGLPWRKESFLSLMDDSEDLKNNFVYRSIDYYDTDTCVDRYLYNADGIQEPEYRFDEEDYINSKWFCYTPEIRVWCESEEHRPEIQELVCEKLKTMLLDLCDEIYEDELEDKLEDDWEDYGEIVVNGSITFEGKNVEAIKRILQDICEKAKMSEGISFSCDLKAVCDDVNKNFAALMIVCENGSVKVGYCDY